MGNHDDHIRRVQAERAALFPKDRIAFRHHPDSAMEDARIFLDYQKGRISLMLACLRIKHSNYLPEVTEEQFLNEYRICGYDLVYNLEKELESARNLHEEDNDADL